MDDHAGSTSVPSGTDGLQSKTRAATARRIVVVLPHLEAGGTQRVALSMSAYWVGHGHEVTVVTWARDAAPDFYRVPPGVVRLRLGERQSTPPGAGARRVEGESPFTVHPATSVAAGPATSAGATSGARRLCDLRASYRALKRQRNAMVGTVARYRLLGRSISAYLSFLRAVYRPVGALRGMLERIAPDVVVSMLDATNVVAVAASAGMPHRTVISERNDPSRKRLDAPWGDLRAVAYPAADAITANSHGALEMMRAYCPARKLWYAPNPLVLPERTVEGVRTDAVLCLARLVPQKAPDVLIEAFAQFHRGAPKWALHLAGDGAMAEALQARVRALGLAGQVTFHGNVADPAPLLAQCAIFALSSRFEGTPNALLEAMAHRMACIVSDASPGPLRLIEDGISGLIVETDSSSALAAALERLARDEPLRRRLGDAAFERVKEFRLDRVGPIWDRILFPDEGQAP